MLETLRTTLAPAVMERLTLGINHVLASEAVATERLRAHAGRSLRLHLEHWPRLLPAPPALAFLVTPAGLLEWRGIDAPDDADLHIHLDAGNPAGLLAQSLSGATPRLAIDGDAGLASDIHWLAENLRWDLAADLEPLIGATAAHQVVRFGGALKRGLQRALGFVQRAGPGSAGATPPGSPPSGSARAADTPAGSTPPNERT